MDTRTELVKSGDGALVEYGTITHQGKDYTAVGAVISESELVGYVKGNRLVTWAGHDICALRLISTWRTPFSWQSSTRSAYRASHNGREFHGTGFGQGMVLKMKACKAVR